MGTGRMGYAGTAFLSCHVPTKGVFMAQDIDDMIDTPFGFFPMGDAATGNAAEAVRTAHNTSSVKFEPHWLFAHLFNDDGSVK